MKAYHFVNKTLRCGSPVPADGEWLEHHGKVKICSSGLHASKHPFDAFHYAPGPILCLVECEDIVKEVKDKLVCRRRKIVKRIEATELLNSFARWCALSVIDLWDAPPVVIEYLQTGDECLRLEACMYAKNSRGTFFSVSSSHRASMSAQRAAMDTVWSFAESARDAARAVRASRPVRPDWFNVLVAQRNKFNELVDNAF